MTKKHLEAVAKNIEHAVRLQENNVNGSSDVIDALEDLAKGMSYTFETFNANFDRTRFLTACGF